MSLQVSRVTSWRTYLYSIFEEVKLTKRSGCSICQLVTLCGSITQLVIEYNRQLPGSESDNDGDNDDDGDTSPQDKEEVIK